MQAVGLPRRKKGCYTLDMSLFWLAFLIALVGTSIFEYMIQHNGYLRDRLWENHLVIMGYHFHHSMYGLLSLMVATYRWFLDKPHAAFFLGVGIGIILMHTITEKAFVFMEREDY